MHLYIKKLNIKISTISLLNNPNTEHVIALLGCDSYYIEVMW